LSAGTWYHMAATFDSGTSDSHIYVDGVDVTLSTTTQTITTNDSPLFIGARPSPSPPYPKHFVRGVIDEARIWNRALSDEEVKRHAWGLVGEWLFEEGSGTTAHDTSGFENHGTIHGSPAWDTGKYGTAISFDGDDYINLGSTVDNGITTSITLEAWIKPTSKQRGGIISNDVTYYSPHKGFDFFLWDDDVYGRLYLDFGDGATLGRMWYSIPNMDWYNKWHHVAGTWDGVTMKLYVDGIEVPELTHSGPYSDSGRNNLIGAISYTSVLWPFNGVIDEVRIWNKALVPVEFCQTGLDSSAQGRVVTVDDPIELEYDDLCFIMMVESGTEVTYTYEQIVSSNIIGKSFSLDSVTGGASPSDTITVTDPTTITGNYVTQYETSVDIDPDTLNLKSNGQWITAYITLPEGYSVEDINPEMVCLDGIPAVWSEIQNGVFMAKFDRAKVIVHLDTTDLTDDCGAKFYPVTLTVTGNLLNGQPFEGSDTIRVMTK